MTGVDTNIIVRLLICDDKQQYLKAKTVFANEQIFIADTVILETEWVLRFSYKFTPDKIRHFFETLFGLPNVHLSNRKMIDKTLRLYATGLDFADAIHLAANHQQDTFFTFDKTLIRRSKDLTSCQVIEPCS